MRVKGVVGPTRIEFEWPTLIPPPIISGLGHRAQASGWAGT